MGKKKHETDYWRGIPQELKYMCLSEVVGKGNYCTEAVIDYLLDNMYNCDKIMNHKSPYDIIRQLDVAIESCLFPLEIHKIDWCARLEDIGKILTRYEDLVRKVAPADYREGYRTTDDDRLDFNLIKYAQKLNVYFCVLHMYLEDWEKMQIRLKMLLSDTKLNVGYLISCKSAEKNAAADDCADIHFIGTDAWIPINWLSKEYIPEGKALRYVIKSYHEYAVFLENEEVSFGRSTALKLLRAKAEMHLDELCNLALDKIYDEEKDAKEGNQMLSDIKAELIEILHLSDIRKLSIGKPEYDEEGDERQSFL